MALRFKYQLTDYCFGYFLYDQILIDFWFSYQLLNWTLNNYLQIWWPSMPLKLYIYSIYLTWIYGKWIHKNMLNMNSLAWIFDHEHCKCISHTLLKKYGCHIASIVHPTWAYRPNSFANTNQDTTNCHVSFTCYWPTCARKRMPPNWTYMLIIWFAFMEHIYTYIFTYSVTSIHHVTRYIVPMFDIYHRTNMTASLQI